MSLARFALALAVTGYVARWVLKSRRLMAAEAQTPDITDSDAFAKAPSLPANQPTESPNAGERLQAGPVAGAGAPDANQLLGSSPQHGPYAEGPGLGDFARGA